MTRHCLFVAAMFAVCVCTTRFAVAVDPADDSAEARDAEMGKIPSVEKLVSEGWKGTFSPDGTRLAYGKKDRSGLFIRDSINDTLTELAEAGKDATWSPDGRLLAYGGFNTDRFGVWVLNPSTKQARPKQARRFAKGAYTMPTWSPDGTKLLFDYRAEEWEIWSIDVRAIWDRFEVDDHIEVFSDRD